MRIEEIRGKRLLAVLEKDKPIDLDVCQKIADLCRVGQVTRVALVYPLRRLSQVVPFMDDVATITGQPVEGFSHNE